MRRSTWYVLGVMLLILIGWALMRQRQQQAEWSQWWEQAQRRTFVSANESDTGAADWALAWWRDWDHEPPAALGFEVRRTGFWRSIKSIRPKADAHGDEGIHAMRQNAKVDVLLQAPHAQYDRHSGWLVERWFLEQSVTGLMQSSSPRVRAGVSTASNDLAHRTHSHFQAMTVGFAVARPSARIVQLHGFAVDKRQQQSSAAADVIASAGQREPTAYVRSVCDCLRAAGLNVQLFPLDTQELGALSNAQVKALHNLSFRQFVHLELSEELRLRLRESKTLRDRVFRCL